VLFILLKWKPWRTLMPKFAVCKGIISGRGRGIQTKGSSKRKEGLKVAGRGARVYIVSEQRLGIG